MSKKIFFQRHPERISNESDIFQGFKSLTEFFNDLRGKIF